MLVRLNKFLAGQGVASRRAADRLIAEGRVAVNGLTVEDLGVRIDAEKDAVAVDGKAVRRSRESVTVMLHKPAGYLVTLDDPFRRPTVRDLLSGLREPVFPVGRLDLDSEGLLLLTNDGELAFRLTHPRFEVPKTYLVCVRGDVTDEEAGRLERGIILEGRRTAPARVRVVDRNPGRTVLSLELHEGRKREVRLMLGSLGHRVKTLRRVEFAGLQLSPLPKGKWRFLKKDEVRSLRRRVGLE